MTSTYSYLITMFAGMFWLLRVIVATTYSMSIEFPILPSDFTTEVILLFVTLFCMIFIIKRKIIGALVYFVAQGLYFGTDLYNGIISITNGETGIMDYTSLFISFIGVLIPLLIVLDIFFNKEGKGSTKNKKTDWFYTNEQYDRKLDERADKNQYKF